MRRLVAGALIAVVALAGGCGYRLAGTATSVPVGTKSVAIGLFANHTREKGLEVSLQRAIEDEFRRRGTLDVVRDPEGDVVVSGSIRRFTVVPIAYGASDAAQQYVGSLLLRIRLRDRRSGRLLYQNDALQETMDFGATAGVVVTTSPRFQEETVNARDLVELTNVQIGETRRRQALSELVDRVARDVYVHPMEGF